MYDLDCVSISDFNILAYISSVEFDWEDISNTQDNVWLYFQTLRIEARQK